LHLDRRFDAIDGRFRAVEGRFAAVDRRFDSLESKMTRQFMWTVGLMMTLAAAAMGGLLAR
jgi:hypothetical protein